MAYINCRDASSEIRTGDLFELIPPHGDTTAKMHDRYYGIRNGRVEVIWPNLGRGSSLVPQGRRSSPAPAQE